MSDSKKDRAILLAHDIDPQNSKMTRDLAAEHSACPAVQHISGNRAIRSFRKTKKAPGLEPGALAHAAGQLTG